MGKRREKNRNLGPRRKRMRRPARLQAAIKWRSSYGGKNIVRGYARWFGVDLLCAIAELRMVGVVIDPGYEEQVRLTISARAAARARARAAKLAATEPVWLDTSPSECEWNDGFSSDEDNEPFDEIPF